jgi:hypothetical protein
VRIHPVQLATTVARELARDRTLDDLEWAAEQGMRAEFLQGRDFIGPLEVEGAHLMGKLAVSILKAQDTPLTRRGLRALVDNLYRRLTEATTPAMRQAYRRAGRYLTQRWPGLTQGQREDVVGEVVDRMRADFIAAAIPTAPIVGDAVERTIAATRQATAARHRLTIPQVFSTADEAVADHARRAHAIYVRDQLGGIVTGPLADVVRSTIARGLDDGLDGETIGRDLEKLLAGTGAERTRAYHSMVARTAVTRARTYGVLSSFRSAAITRYEVVAIRDEHCCAVCYFMHGRTFDVGPALDRFLAASAAPPEDVGVHQPFMGVARIAGELHVGVRTVGGFVPVAGYSPPATPTGDRIFTPRVADSAIQSLGAGAPPFHPNCRCTIAPLFGAVQVPATLPTAAPAPALTDAARRRAGLPPAPIGRFQVQVIAGRPRVGPPLSLLSPADAAADWTSRPSVDVTPDLLERVFGKQVPRLDDVLAAWTDDDGGVEVRDLVVQTYGAAELNLSFQLCDRTGKLLTTKGRASRTVSRDGGKLIVHNNFLRLSKAAPKGAGARITRNSLATYSKIGVDKVEVDAAWIGKHAWATFGFQWDAAEAAKRRAAFGPWLQAKAGMTAAEARRAVSRIDFANPWEVADFDVPGRTVEVEVERDDDAGPTFTRSQEPLGKAFLLSQGMWSGEIDLTRPDAPSWRRALQRVFRQ